ADMAGAEQQAAHSMDPGSATRVAWGDNGPYDSLVHATRVLAGRWEMGDNLGDPQCGGSRALELLNNVFGDDRTARLTDTPIQSAGQADAAQVVEKTGIVVP